MNKTKTLSWEYIAGLFDGEGTVGVYRVGKSKNGKQYWSVKLSIVGTHRPMIEAVYNMVGLGLFTTQKRQAIQQTPKGPIFGKQGWKWMLNARKDILFFLSKIEPFLIEKNEQANIAMRFCQGEIDGESASTLCKEAKRFVFPTEDFEEYAPRKLGGLAGTNNPSSKLNEYKVREIKILLKDQTNTQTEIADMYSVSKSVVHQIAHGKSWTHVTL